MSCKALWCTKRVLVILKWNLPSNVASTFKTSNQDRNRFSVSLTLGKYPLFCSKRSLLRNNLKWQMKAESYETVSQKSIPFLDHLDSKIFVVLHFLCLFLFALASFVFLSLFSFYSTASSSPLSPLPTRLSGERVFEPVGDIS